MILYLSGNGNSRAVARELARLLGDDVRRMMHPDDWSPSAAKCVVWVMPVHSWGPPVAFFELLSQLSRKTFAAGSLHHLVLTCGDDCGHAHRLWRAILRARGWRTAGEWSVQMPNTYVLLPGFDVDPEDLAAKKLEAMPARVAEIARRIEADGESAESDIVQGALPRLKTRLVYPLFARYDIRPDKFNVNVDQCVSCGRCASVCPCDNIVLSVGSAGSPAPTKKRPVWSDSCTMCLGCYNCCPAHAISYGRRTRGKGQFFNSSD